MKTFQLFVRLHELDPWIYVDTYRGASLVWTAMGLARARGCHAKVTGYDAATAQADVMANA